MKFSIIIIILITQSLSWSPIFGNTLCSDSPINQENGWRHLIGIESTDYFYNLNDSFTETQITFSNNSIQVKQFDAYNNCSTESLIGLGYAKNVDTATNEVLYTDIFGIKITSEKRLLIGKQNFYDLADTTLNNEPYNSPTPYYQKTNFEFSKLNSDNTQSYNFIAEHKEFRLNGTTTKIEVDFTLNSFPDSSLTYTYNGVFRFSYPIQEDISTTSTLNSTGEDIKLILKDFDCIEIRQLSSNSLINSACD